MELTLTVKGDTLTPEVADLLQKLGIALQGGSSTEVATEPDAAPKTEKKARGRKVVEKVAEATTEAVENVKETAERLTLEELRKKAMEVLNAGKSTEFKKVLKEFDLKSLSEAKAEDYATLYEKISQL